MSWVNPSFLFGLQSVASGRNGVNVRELARRFWRLGIKLHLLWILAAVVLVAWFGPPRLFEETWQQVLVGLAVGGGVDGAITWFRKQAIYLPQSGFITGLIVAIVLAPGSPIWQVAAAVAVGILSKHLIRFQGRQVFNPAAVGLLAVIAFAGAIDGWWGDVTPWLVVLLGAFIVTRTRKWQAVAAFAAAWLLAAFVRMPALESIQSAARALPLFFMAVMLIEPMTTPALARVQVAYGVLAGVLAAVFMPLVPAVGLLASLLAANLCAPFIGRFLRPAVPRT